MTNGIQRRPQSVRLDLVNRLLNALGLALGLLQQVGPGELHEHPFRAG